MKNTKRKNVDPYSTPARRRRIIAVFAKSTLRHYCVTACSRVARQRLERWAAIKIQCLLRRVLAVCLKKRLLFTRNTKAAIKVQSFVRMVHAMKYLKKLRVDAYHRNAKLLAKRIEELYFAAKKRARRRAYLTTQRSKKMGKLHRAAIEIQRVFRGMLGRRRFELVKCERERNRAAAISMQCKVRQFLAGMKLQALRRKMAATARIIAMLIRWRRRRRVRRERGALVIQRFSKSLRSKLLTRKRLSYRRREFEYVNQATEVAMRDVVNGVVSDCIPEPPEMALARQTLAVHVEVGAGLFQRMHADVDSPSSVLQWCMDHSILRFRRDGIAAGQEGFFTEGAALQQVVDSVRNTLSLQHGGSGGDDGGGGSEYDDEQLIILSKLEEDSCDNKAVDEESIRSVLHRLRWGDICEGYANNGVVRLVLLRESTEQTMLKFLSYHHDHGSSSSSTSSSMCRRTDGRVRRRVSDIDLFDIFNPLDVETEINIVLKCHPSQSEAEEKDSDSKFRLNNALVFVSGNLIASRLRYNDLVCTNDSFQQQAAAVGDDYVDGGAVDGGGDDVLGGGDIEQQRRPPTAAPQQVMRILVRQRTPSPIIDYELYATIIQRVYRVRLARIHLSSRKIQIFVRRYNRFKKLVLLGWRQLVHMMVSKLTHAVLVLQCCMRRKLAMNLKIRLLNAKRLQEEKDKFSFGNEYGFNDLEGMWAAFGLQARGGDEGGGRPAGTKEKEQKKKNLLVAVAADKITKSPPVPAAESESKFQKGPPAAHSYSAFSSHHYPPHSTAYQNLKSPPQFSKSSSSNSNELKEFLNIIQLPDPPPNCVRPDLHGIVSISGEQDPSDAGKARTSAKGAGTSTSTSTDNNDFVDGLLNTDPIAVSQFTSELLTTSFNEIEQFYTNINGGSRFSLFKGPFDGDESCSNIFPQEDSLGNVIFATSDQESFQVFSQDSTSTSTFITPLLEKISKLNFNS